MADLIARLQAALVDRYNVERELGAGGMATVYLANDLRHHRQVAIKVLRPDLAATLGPERFLREIEIAARLQHPHILPLHDSGDAEGLLYYVMPYVEGESLRQRLVSEKQLPLEDAFQITRAVASALGYAHSHDVVHRDIKPENILLSGGEAVVADFGIARAIRAAGGDKLTATGIAVGTPAYMSPEQVAGGAQLDGRTDVYSLGCVLYEMLAGEPPFTGPTAESVAHQHLTAPPPLVTRIRPAVLASVARVIARALAKSPADRFATADQFAEALEATGEEQLRSAGRRDRSNTLPRAAGAVRGNEGSRRDSRVLYAVIALAILMTGAAIWGWTRPAPSKPVVRYTLVVDSTQAIAQGESWTGRMALSPDGSRLAYIGGPRAQLLIRPRNELRATAVPGTEGASTPFFSPDGSQVGLLEELKVRIVSIKGGSSFTVTDTLTGLAGASWGADGFIYVDGSGPTSLLRVEAKPGAKPRWFTVLDTARGEFDHTWPDVLPNGKGVLFTVSFKGRQGVKGRTSYSIAVADIPSGKHRVIVDDAMYSRYATSGHLLYVTTNKTLMVVPFDQNSMKVTGEPTALVEGMRLGLLGSADLAVSATGTLVYTTGAGQGQHELVWVTRGGKAQALDPDWAHGAFLWSPTISPDGKWLAVARNANTEFSVNIWVKRLDRGPSTKLTLEGMNNLDPAWTPDGKSVTYSSDARGGIFQLWTKRADGSAEAVMQVHQTRNLLAAQWSPDGTWLIFETDPYQPGSGDILAIRPGIDSAPLPLVVSKFTETSPALSPDGRWLAYMSNESGDDEIYVVPFPSTSAAKWTMSTGGGTEPLWSHRGNELFYRDASGNLVAVEVKTKPTFSPGRSTPLFAAAGFASERFRPQYAVASDDRRYLMIRLLATDMPEKLIVVENWFEELRAKSRK